MRKILNVFLLLGVALSLRAQEAPEGLFISSRAADFRAKDQNGTEIRLKDELKKGKVVIVFYRGQWSIHCMRFLARLQDSLAFIKEKGATLIAITPEKPESVAMTIDTTHATYSVISDEDLKIMKAYDVEYEVPENTITRYRNAGIDVDKNNGKNGKFLPVPAVYIVDKESTVIYRFFEPDYKKRPNVKDILAKLE